MTLCTILMVPQSRNIGRKGLQKEVKLLFPRTIYKCGYSNTIGDVSDCSALMNLSDVHEDAEPRGLATDTSDHLWVAVANVGDNGAVVEINPETKSVVSTFGQIIRI